MSQSKQPANVVFKKRCQCDWCKRYAEFKRLMRSGTKAELKKFIDALFEDWTMQGEDLGYANAILDGSWPSAVEQLERSLLEARKIAKEREVKP